MNKNFSVKRWPSELALEEIRMEQIPIWVQISGLPLNMCMETSARRLAREVGEFLEMESLDLARGFMRVKISVDTTKPLVVERWVSRAGDIDSWIEFRYERLQEFCYKCGRIGHVNTGCSDPQPRSSEAGFGDWTRAK